MLKDKRLSKRSIIEGLRLSLRERVRPIVSLAIAMILPGLGSACKTETATNYSVRLSDQNRKAVTAIVSSVASDFGFEEDMESYTSSPLRLDILAA